jgi:hypothetical protein
MCDVPFVFWLLHFRSGFGNLREDIVLGRSCLKGRDESQPSDKIGKSRPSQLQTISNKKVNVGKNRQKKNC